MVSLNLTRSVSLEWGNNYIKVSGPLGILVKRKDEFSIAKKDTKLYLWSTKSPEKEATFLANLKSLIVGVTKGFTQKLRLVGVGYRANLIKNILILKIGYSHEISYTIPLNIKIVLSKNKGIIILIKGQEYQKVKQVAMEIRKLRIPNPYTGKGIHFAKEIIKLKKGKREGK
jgi:large subunit ribosomal protein L6